MDFLNHEFDVKLNSLIFFMRFTMIIQNCLKFPNIDFKTKLHRFFSTESGRKTKLNIILSSSLKVELRFIQIAVEVYFENIFYRKHQKQYKTVRGLR